MHLRFKRFERLDIVAGDINMNYKYVGDYDYEPGRLTISLSIKQMNREMVTLSR